MKLFFFSSRRRHTRYIGDWSSDVCSSDLEAVDHCRRGACRRPGRGDRRGGGGRRAGKAEHEGGREPGGGSGHLILLAGKGQIGRASCRESVEDAGEGVAVKEGAVVAACAV